MKKSFFSFRIALAIVAMATLGAVTSCSEDDGMMNDVELQEQASLKSMSAPGDPIATSNGGTMHDDTVYVTTFKRHYGGSYPNYVSEVFDFSSNQLAAYITPSVTSNSSAPVTDGMITFFNQTAYKSGSPKGCPGFIVGDDYEVVNYTDEMGSSYSGLSTLRCLELSDVENLTYSGEGTPYSLPFLTSTHSSCFSGGNLQQSCAHTYYDTYLTIGRQWHGNCGGDYSEPIWVITDGVDYWAFCVDPYQNGSSTPDKYYSTFNYKKLN
jgi:hypothetical protein